MGNEETKKKILESLKGFAEGKWGYYIKPIGDKNMIIYIYDSNGIREIDYREWAKEMGLNVTDAGIAMAIASYKKLGIIKDD